MSFDSDIQTVIYRQRPPSNVREGFARKPARILGFMHVFCGLFEISSNIVAIWLKGTGAQIGTGIWSGAFFLLTGIIGFVAVRTRTHSSIVFFMIFSVTSAVLVIAPLVGGAIGATYDSIQDINYVICVQLGRKDSGNGTGCDRRFANVAMFGLMIAFAILELAVSMCSTFICCSTTCCGHLTPKIVQIPAVQFVNTPDGGRQAVFVMPLSTSGDDSSFNQNFYYGNADANTGFRPQAIGVPLKCQVDSIFPPSYENRPPEYAEDDPENLANSSDFTNLQSIQEKV